MRELNVNGMVTCPNPVLEFNAFHINQVLDSYHRLFTLEDVIQHVEIWRYKYAIAILHQISNVFGDINMEIYNVSLPMKMTLNKTSQ